MDKVIIITQARVGSTRLPSKVLLEINKKSLLEIHLNRLKKCLRAENIILATTNEEGVEKLIQIAKKLKVNVYQGDTTNVLKRFYNASKNLNVDYIVRVTSDCPLIDHKIINDSIKIAIKYKLDYVSNTLIETFPDGQDVEVFSFYALQKTFNNAHLASDKEHVTPFMRRNSDFNDGELFSSMNIESRINYKNVRMTVDEIEDFQSIKLLIENLGENKSWKTYTKFILSNPKLFF